MLFRSRSSSVASVIATLLLPVVTLAAGFEIPDNGAVVGARGGSTAALLDTAYGVAFNPAGLTFMDGLDVRLDLRLASHDVSYTRAEEGRLEFDPAVNEAGLFPGPFIAAAYRLSGDLDQFAFGIGIFGPPGIAVYRYADPTTIEEEGAGTAEINARTGHRYMLIDSNIVIAFPTISLAWRPMEQLSLGVSMQSVYSSVAMKQALAAVGGFGETWEFDAIADVSTKDAFTPTALMGVVYEPMKGLRLSASFRPTVAVDAEGSVDVTLSQAVKDLGVTVEGNTTALTMSIPPVARLGVAYQQDAFDLGFDLVYEGWSAVDKFVLTADVSTVTAGVATALEPIEILKNWEDSYGARFGGAYRPLAPGGDIGLEIGAGGTYESNAIPSAFQALDFVTGSRLGAGLGATVSYLGFGLTLGGMYYLPVSFDVSDSQVARASSVPGGEDPPVIVANGQYESKIWTFAVGLSYTTPASTSDAPVEETPETPAEVE